MKDSVVWRMVWKKYRLLRGFWLGLAGLTVFFQLIVLVMPMHETAENGDRWMMIFATGITMGALYALACGATMFATEHEEGTFDFLRALPVRPGQLLAGKLVHSVLSTIVFFVVLWGVSALLTSFRFPAASTYLQLWALRGQVSCPGTARLGAALFGLAPSPAHCRRPRCGRTVGRGSLCGCLFKSDVSVRHRAAALSERGSHTAGDCGDCLCHRCVASHALVA